MSAIAPTASFNNYSAVAQLLADGSSNTAAAGAASQIGESGSSGSPAATSSGPSDSVNLSDHAKAVLAQAQKDQVAANQLQSFLQSARNPAGTGGNAAPSQSSAGTGTQVFDKLTGQAQSQQGGSANSLADFIQSDGLLNGLVAYARTLEHRDDSGTVASYSQTIHDVTVAAPSNPQQIAAWYQGTDAQGLASAAQFWPDNDPGLAEALASHAVTFLNASDIPDLNFHNTITIQGGEGGGSEGDIYSYNQKAAIFSDPTTSYKVLADGTVLSWKTPPAIGTTASN
jgi:hypothetical protein